MACPAGEILGALHRAWVSVGKRLGLGKEGRRRDPDAAQYSIAECGRGRHLQRERIQVGPAEWSCKVSRYITVSPSCYAKPAPPPPLTRNPPEKISSVG